MYPSVPLTALRQSRAPHICKHPRPPRASALTFLDSASIVFSRCSAAKFSLTAASRDLTSSSSFWAHGKGAPMVCACALVSVSCLYVCFNPLTFEKRLPLRCIHASLCAKVHGRACRHAYICMTFDSSRIEPLAWQSGTCASLHVANVRKCAPLRVHLRET
jgi:hypothetical protein